MRLFRNCHECGGTLQETEAWNQVVESYKRVERVSHAKTIVRDVMITEFCNEDNPGLIQMSRRFLKKKTRLPIQETPQHVGCARRLERLITRKLLNCQRDGTWTPIWRLANTTTLIEIIRALPNKCE